MVTINWTKIAKDDLKSIFDYISRDSRVYAFNQIERIRTKTRLLKLNPEIGKIVPEYNKNSLRELIEGNYRIIYRKYSKSIIDIITVHHGARNLLLRNIDLD